MNFKVKISPKEIVLLIYIIFSGLGVKEGYGQISVKFWADDKKSAFTFTLDDCCMSQYTYAAPLLESFNFKGTFDIITDSLTDDLPAIARYGTWKQFDSLAIRGHEIGSHSVTHPDLTAIPIGDTGTVKSLVWELYQSQKAINERIPIQKCIVLSYPNLAYNLDVETQASQYYASARTGGTYPVDGSLANLDYYRIVANEALFNLPRNSPSDDLDELAQMETYADSCVKVGGWGLLELHEVVPFSQIPQLVINKEWYPTSTEWLTSFCQHLKQNSDSGMVWVETMGNITRYMRERQDFMWDILSQTDTEMQIHGYDTLDDGIYNYPLTVDITVPDGWTKVIFSQGSRSDTLSTFIADGSTNVRTHFIPDGGIVILDKIIPVIAITSPNGGENWRVGQVDTVKWTSSNVSYVKIELTADNGTSWSTIKDSVSASIGHYAWMVPDSISTLCLVRLTDEADTSIKNVSATNFTIAAVPVLTLTALIEGLYNGTSMKSDTVSVELHNSSSPFGLIDSTQGVLDTTGTGKFSFINAVNGVPYYVVVKQRSSIETWSLEAHSFTSFSLSYDFTSAQGQAYGNNLVLKGTKYCIYSGDVNQDGVVDLSDMIAADNDSTNKVTGSVSTDINRDGVVDMADIIIIDNNNLNYVVKTVPMVTPLVKKEKKEVLKSKNNL